MTLKAIQKENDILKSFICNMFANANLLIERLSATEDHKVESKATEEPIQLVQLTNECIMTDKNGKHTAVFNYSCIARAISRSREHFGDSVIQEKKGCTILVRKESFLTKLSLLKTRGQLLAKQTKRYLEWREKNSEVNEKKVTKKKK
jgi:hypothetical protein